jgi:hypothetical protein
VGADEREAGGPVHIRGRRATQQRGAFAPPPWRAGSAASAGTRVAPSRRRPLFRPGFIALVFVLLAGGGGAAYVVLTREDDDPRTDDLVALAERPADESAADLRPRDGRVSLAVDGIAVPDWRRDKGWRAVGARRDKLRDHDAATVFYERRGDRVALTIAERPALERPADAETVRGPRRSFLSASLRGRETLVWYRGGRTLVLSSADVPRQTLLKLVS